MEGTPWFFSYCDLHEGKDWCSKDDSWCNDPWCYVSKSRCNSWTSSSVFPAATDLGFSYVACAAIDCYTDKAAKGCPYEGNGQLDQCQECADDDDGHDHDHDGTSDSDGVSGASSIFMGPLALLVAVMATMW